MLTEARVQRVQRPDCKEAVSFERYHAFGLLTILLITFVSRDSQYGFEMVFKAE